MPPSSTAATAAAVTARDAPRAPADMSYAERSLAIACTRGREAIVIRFRDLLKKEGLTEQQWRVMRILNDHGPMIIAELTKLSCIHKASMSRIVASLESSGLLEKGQSADDARASVMALSKAGNSMMQRMVPIASRIYDGIIADLGVEKYRQLLTLLQDLAAINEGQER